MGNVYGVTTSIYDARLKRRDSYVKPRYTDQVYAGHLYQILRVLYT